MTLFQFDNPKTQKEATTNGNRHAFKDHATIIILFNLLLCFTKTNRGLVQTTKSFATLECVVKINQRSKIYLTCFCVAFKFICTKQRH
jgi:hypothetical protein